MTTGGEGAEWPCPGFRVGWTQVLRRAQAAASRRPMATQNRQSFPLRGCAVVIRRAEILRLLPVLGVLEAHRPECREEILPPAVARPH